MLAAPVLALAALATKLTSRGPVLFRQERIGLGGEPFELLKLRTMRCATSPDHDAAHRAMCAREIAHPELPAGTSDGLYKLEDDPRVTRVGRVLRRLSFDELPQLVNVLRGEMALVGPRPMLPWEFELCDHRQRRRVEVLPGVTGLWQVRGRSRLSMGTMLEIDLEYVDRRSTSTDLGILLRTFGVLVRGDGAR